MAESGAVKEETRRIFESVRYAQTQPLAAIAEAEQRPLLICHHRTPEPPVTLIEDTSLRPLDKVIWLILMRHATEKGDISLMPTHAQLAEKSNVAARITVGMALASLRCARWLTVCQTVLRKGDTTEPGAYALQSAPLPVADTCYLDPQYPDYLKIVQKKARGHLRRAALQALASL